MAGSILNIWEAVWLACEEVKRLSATEVPVMDAIGMILAEDVFTRIDQPPFPRSAMDGYAIYYEDTLTAERDKPARLKVVGCQYAGDPYFRALQRGEALRIMTGAAIPEGANAVIRQEDTDYGEDQVEIYRPAKHMEAYCPIGEDFPKGDLLARAGEMVDAYLIAAAVAAGISTLYVSEPIHAAILTTGDELQMSGTALQEGKIYNSNLALFASRLKQLNCVVDIAEATGDDLYTIAKKMTEAAKSCQLIITTGGVSVGVKDLMPAVIERTGAREIFHGISIKPGMPTMFSMYGDVPVISLSGNPYSAAAVFELLVQPVIRKMTGQNREVLEKVTGIAQHTFPGKTACDRFLRGYYDHGKIAFEQGQHNGQTKAGIGTNCLIHLPAGREAVAAGEELTAYLI